MRSIINRAVVTLLLLLPFFLEANPDDLALQKQLVSKAEAKFKATFTNTGISAFGPSPIEGIYEIKTQGGIIYYEPKNGMLIFGKIYNKDGQDLTQLSEDNHNNSVLTQLPLEHALVLGNPDAKKSYVEFTNPHCGHCISYDRWAQQQDSQDIKRYVFFLVGPGQGKDEAIHILCHPEDYRKIYNREPVSLKTCEQGVQRLKHHSTAVKIAGPSATPSFIVDGKPFVGFDETTLTNLYIGN